MCCLLGQVWCCCEPQSWLLPKHPNILLLWWIRRSSFRTEIKLCSLKSSTSILTRTCHCLWSLWIYFCYPLINKRINFVNWEFEGDWIFELDVTDSELVNSCKSCSVVVSNLPLVRKIGRRFEYNRHYINCCKEQNQKNETVRNITNYAFKFPCKPRSLVFLSYVHY